MKRTFLFGIAFLILCISAVAQPPRPPKGDGQRDGDPGGLPKVNATICDTSRSENTLRVLYWNIQNGMWADQANNYDKFVEWVKQYDPDICVWIEAGSLFVDDGSSQFAQEDKYLPGGWPEVAARYGHEYTAVGFYPIVHPQVVTSKYPIETLATLRKTDDPITPINNGAAIQCVKAGDLEICIVTQHAWPFQYRQGLYGHPQEEQNASAEAHEGDYSRQIELEYLCAHTVNDPQYADRKNWLLLGDFNCISPVDNWHYGLPEDDSAFLGQKAVIQNTDLIDVIARRFPGQFVASHAGGKRIDYIYASEPMYDRIDKAMTLTDDWTFAYKVPISNFYYPSDHFPLLVDFRK